MPKAVRFRNKPHLNLSLLLETVFKEQPMVHHLLQSRGVDPEICDEAQELVADVWLTVQKQLTSQLRDHLYNIESELFNKVKDFSQELIENFDPEYL